MVFGIRCIRDQMTLLGVGVWGGDVLSSSLFDKSLTIKLVYILFPNLNFKAVLPFCFLDSALWGLFIQMKKTHFSFERPSFSVIFKGIRASAEYDGISVSFHHSSTSPQMEWDLYYLYEVRMIWTWSMPPVQQNHLLAWWPLKFYEKSDGYSSPFLFLRDILFLFSNCPLS